MYYETREEWLKAAIIYMRPWFVELGLKAPAAYVSVGYPTQGARSATVGQCCYGSEDGIPHVFIHPAETDPVRVLDILEHELIHTVMPIGTGHKAPFAKAAKALGRMGPPTHDTITPEMAWNFARMVRFGLGPWPHAGLTVATGRKKQATRQLKVACPNCLDDEGKPYIARMTRKWLDAMGAPICPGCNEQMMEAG
jgi:hypothetical protein